MSLTERAACRFAGYLYKRGRITEKEQTVYRYLAQLWMEKLLAAGTVLLLAGWLHMLPESLLFFMVFIPLRSFAGGLHLETYAACYTGSVLSFTAVLVLTKELGALCPAPLAAAAGLLCLAGIKLLAPVESGKRLITPKARRRFARNLNAVVLLLTIFQLLLAVFDIRRIAFLLTATELLQLLFLTAGKAKYQTKKTEC